MKSCLSIIPLLFISGFLFGQKETGMPLPGSQADNNQHAALPLSLNEKLSDEKVSSRLVLNEKLFTACRIYQNGYLINLSQLEDILKTNGEAYAYYKKADNLMGPERLVALTGGIIIGYSAGNILLEGVDKKSILGVGIGIGLLGVTAALRKSINEFTRKAVTIYNSTANQALPEHLEFKMGATENGLGFVVAF